MRFARSARVATGSEVVVVGGSRKLDARSCRVTGRREISAETSGNSHGPCSSCECSSWPNSTAWWLEATSATDRPTASGTLRQLRVRDVIL